MPEDIIKEKTTDANGRIVWSDLKHGTYYVKETTTGADDLNDKGYGISNEGAEVVIESGTLVKDVNEKAGAVIYVQKSPEEKEAGTWTELKNFEDISTDHTVDFDGQVVGVKVVYTNTLEYFTSGEIVLNVTFANRSETSTENDHEVRRIINQADIS